VRSGHECSAANPDNPWSNYRVNGSCPADADYAYYMQQSLGPELYAQVYSRAQEIEQAMRAGNFDSVLATLKIDMQSVDERSVEYLSSVSVRISRGNKNTE